MSHIRREPISAAEVNAEIWFLIQRCNKLLTEYHGAGEKRLTAKDMLDDKFARELLTAPEGTVQEKKANADKKCRSESLEFLKADTRFKYLKLAIDTTRDELVALESIGSNLRQQNDLDKYRT